MRAAIALLIAGIHGGALADGIQAQCGSEQGVAFAAEQGFITGKDAGWYDDKTTGETVIRIDIDTGEVDVRFKDATKVWQSVTDQGGRATIWAIQDEPPGFMVVVGYPGTTVEVLTLAEIDGSSAKLIHTVSRSMTSVTNARVMVADCVVTTF